MQADSGNGTAGGVVSGSGGSQGTASSPSPPAPSSCDTYCKVITGDPNSYCINYLETNLPRPSGVSCSQCPPPSPPAPV